MTDSRQSPTFIEFTSPGKTFLLGEYLALEGGPSIVLATAPSFALSASRRDASKSSASSYSVFHPQSPAGRLMARAPKLYENWELRFKDPHRGRGGLGASSAQFALCWVLEKALAKGEPESGPERSSSSLFEFEFARDWRELLKDYRKFSDLGEGRPPSGADVVAQVQGGVSHFDGINSRARDLGWSFDSLEFVLIRTGKKLATHVHLKDLGQLPFDELRETVVLGTQALVDKSEAAMIEAVKRAAGVLHAANLVASHTAELLEGLKRLDQVLAVKGCGALGADVVLALCRGEESRATIEKWVRSQGLETCGSSRDLAWPELSMKERSQQGLSARSSERVRGVRS